MVSWSDYGAAAQTALGFFWKAGWAFVLGYSVSGMIQAFVPKGRLTRFMGRPDLRSVSLATVFGAASSSCSFAALAAARSLVLKGAHFVAAVAFMFASTNLVIELGILIFIFLGWQFVAAELIGGLLLIAISSLILRATYPSAWLEAAREKVESESSAAEEEFDWRKRITSRYGWHLVGHKFVSDWKMVWEEILIGFTVAGFVAVLVPASFWAKIFLGGATDSLPGWIIVIENAMVAPLVAAATFIGSMGNIPLATVLNANGVLFAGIMGFIYSDLMVPPLVAINAKYYGWRVALYIAAVMFVSIIITAVSLHVGFGALGITPESGRAVEQVTRFALDYTFWLNLAMVLVAGLMVYLHRQHVREHLEPGREGGEAGGIGIKRLVVYLCIALLAGGLIARLLAA
ncbi:MAG: permease [Gemmatimonadetes bacterium]|uniref:Permease n=1 Tax=Candidatus Kutchimonas denitrificans TaxID=3056748 RepID=A0AAE4ZCI1_9BACT|nr:permease [Gemmatimonadota bacterium]NIR75986.1 permease [Candidatus Kutchimonas denitrificans]NIS02178.1 permease [Gemmatimonadota bacterium]NIT68004.1 permease [Gemmatimonadota bacterium]NIU54030.1 permease [Gemmatimonadota bacterium]